MAKKRQTDFQKTKLRVGKTLPKGRNVTDTSFKTRKIVTRDQLKADPGNVPLKELLKHLNDNNVSTKKEALQKLSTYVLEKKDTLSLFFLDILQKVQPTLSDFDGSVREKAIKVLGICLQILSNSQVTCFVELLTNHLNCMMTHQNNAVKKDALKFLDTILNSHPHVICHSTKVLMSLLGLISSVVREKTPSRGRKRKLDEVISSRVTSQQWRAEVLKRICSFLQCALRTENVHENESEDEREIYWDAKKPLYLPLYCRGGSTPVPLESWHGSSNLESINSKELKDVIYDFVPLLPEIIKGEISSKKGDSKLLDSEAIKNINRVVEVLCCLSEWVCHKSHFEMLKDEDFRKLLINVINRQLFDCFPYAEQNSYGKGKKVVKESEVDCMQLNLGVCYLYCLCILDSDSASFENEKAILNYLNDVFQWIYNPGCEMCDKSLSLMLKISKICIKSTNVNSKYKNGILVGLYGILDVDKRCAKPIYSFFIDVSLNYEYKYLLDSEGMKTWFNVILKEMIFMKDTHSVDKRFFKYIRQICSRKYSYFMELLNKVKHEDLLNLLKFDDEEFQLTIIHLICALNDPCDILQDLVDLLNDPSYNMKTVTRIINLLHSRFSRKDVSGKEKLLFLQFLLNLGCDTSVLIDPSWESNEICSDTLRAVLESCHFELHPSLKWERHLKITKICFDCLPTYMQIEPLTESMIMFIKTIMLEHTKLPIHCAIALLKLRRKAFDVYQDEHLGGFYSELIFSSLMYLSVMHLDGNKESLEPYAIPELQKSLQLEPNDVPDIINIINSNIYNFGENELYHALRMTLYLIHAKILHLDDRNLFYQVLEKINSSCSRSKLLHPLYVTICKFFLFM